MLSKSKIWHKVFWVTLGALCLYFYLYFLESWTMPPTQEHAASQRKEHLSDKERIAECSYSETCRLLAEVGFFEARSEKADSAVAGTMFVAMNRLSHGGWGRSLRHVVYSPHQFSYTHDGSLEKGLTDQRAYTRMLRIAHYVWQGEVDDPTSGSLYYHTKHVKPVWRKQMKKTVVLGQHIYYKGS
jgi:spore germination cell wall hydrolase CwlJ-like protein